MMMIMGGLRGGPLVAARPVQRCTIVASDASASPRCQGVRLVLVGPQKEVNLYATLRVAANFAVRQVFLVQPEAEVAEGLQRLRHSGGDDKDCDDLSLSAVDGRRVARDGGAVLATEKRTRLDSRAVTSEDQYAVQCVSSLDSALEDCFDAIAFTRRLGRSRQGEVPFASIGPSVYARRQENAGPIALVFGRESDGLSESEINRCGSICTIPTSPECPSLNLSHAIAVVLSQVFLSRDGHGPAGAAKSTTDTGSRELKSDLDSIASVVEKAALADHIEHSYNKVAVALEQLQPHLPHLTWPPRRRKLSKSAAAQLRRAALGSELSSRQLRILHGVIQVTDQLVTASSQILKKSREVEHCHEDDDEEQGERNRTLGDNSVP